MYNIIVLMKFMVIIMPKFDLQDIMVVDVQCKIKIFYKLLYMVVVNNSKPFGIHLFFLNLC